MKIARPSEMAIKCKTTIRTLHYYSQLGIIPSAKRIGKYFYYPVKVIPMVKRIRRLTKPQYRLRDLTRNFISEE